MADRVLRVLVVDDDRDIINQVHAFLKGPTFEIVVAEQVIEAVSTFEELKPELVLLDIGLPGPSGFVGLRKIRSLAESEKRDVCTIMLTGRSAREDVTTALAYGATDYLVKPFNRAALLGKIQRHFPRAVQ